MMEEKKTADQIDEAAALAEELTAVSAFDYELPSDTAYRILVDQAAQQAILGARYLVQLKAARLQVGNPDLATIERQVQFNKLAVGRAFLQAKSMGYAGDAFKAAMNVRVKALTKDL